MQRREQHAQDDEHDHHAAYNPQRLLQIEVLQHDGRELQRQHRGVEHHAIGNLKHHRMRIAHDQRMPDIPGQPQVIHQGSANQHVAEERSQDGGPNDRMEALDVEDLDRCGQGEAPAASMTPHMTSKPIHSPHGN